VEKPYQAVPPLSAGLARQVGGNHIIEQLRLDGLEQAIHLGAPQARCVHQQDDISGRRGALGLEAGQDAGVVRIHAVDLDACGFGEVAVQRLIGGVMAGGIEVDCFVLRDGGHGGEGQQQGGEGGFFHGRGSRWVAMEKSIAIILICKNCSQNGLRRGAARRSLCGFAGVRWWRYPAADAKKPRCRRLRAGARCAASGRCASARGGPVP